MMQRKNICGRIICFVLALALCLTAVPVDNPNAQGAEFNINTVLNNAQLHPQKTGYAALDNLLESIVKPLEGQTTAQKVAALYDWTVRNIDYSWDGYQDHTYDGFNVPYPFNDYEEGLPKVMPQEIIDRTYYTISNHKGVCYDWGAVFAVMMRYIGLESYVHTGMFRFEWETQIGHHGWAEVQIDGVNYIFDPQREYRMCGDGVGEISHTRYFGLRYQDTDRYTQETAVNDKRDAGFVSVTAPRIKTAVINGLSSKSGSITGAGTYEVGQKAVLTATPKAGADFRGWYDLNGNLLTADHEYEFTAEKKTTVIAMFGDDQFYDIKDGDWYGPGAEQAAALGLVNGTEPFRFEADGKMTRAMAVKMLASLAKADLSGYANGNFSDVATGMWYAPAINWAAATGIAQGMGNGKFAPDQYIDRQQFVTMLINYLRTSNNDLGEINGALPYKDSAKIAPWTKTAMSQAVAIGLVNGYEDNTIRPQSTLNRAEGVKIIINAVAYLNGN